MLAGLAILATALAPAWSLALTVQDLAAQTTAAQGNYAPVSVTSATNTTIKITATPQTYNGGTWQYQLCWNRTKKAQGSVKVVLKSKKSQAFLQDGIVESNGCDTFSAPPATGLYVMFYSRPNFVGTLLVGKTLTSLAASAAVGNANIGDTSFGYTPNYSSGTTAGSTGSQSQTNGSNNGQTIVNCTGTTNAAGGPLNTMTAAGPVCSMSAAQLIASLNEEQIEAVSLKVGPPIGLPPASSCDYKLFSTAVWGPSRGERSYGFPTLDFTCNSSGMGHIGADFVSSVAYKGSDGKCYLANFNGTWLLPETNCGNLPELPATTQLPYNKIPDPTRYSVVFNWNAAGAQCWHIAGDQVPNIYGAPGGAQCGGIDRNLGVVAPASSKDFCLLHPTDSTCLVTASGTPASVPSAAQLVNNIIGNMGLQKLESMSALVGPSIGLPPTVSCNYQLFLKSSFGPNGGITRGYDQPSWDYSCSPNGQGHIGQSAVTMIAYQGSDNKCYFSNLHGTFLLPYVNCGNLPKLNATTQLPLSAIPDPVDDASFNWGAADAQCFYIAGDQTQIYGGISGSICGAGLHGSNLANGSLPTTASFCSAYPNDPTCQKTITGEAAAAVTAANAPLNDPKTIQRLNTLVGPAIDLGPNSSELNSIRVIQLAYCGSDNKPYFADLTGTYQLSQYSSCGNLPAMNATTQLPYNLIPSATISNFNWAVSGAACRRSLGDGQYASYPCGASYGSFAPATSAEFCKQYPNDQTCGGTQANYSGGGKGSACMKNTDCVSGLYCFGRTTNTTVGYCN